jgi:hypothetical protein
MTGRTEARGIRMEDIREVCYTGKLYGHTRILANLLQSQLHGYSSYLRQAVYKTFSVLMAGRSH